MRKRREPERHRLAGRNRDGGPAGTVGGWLGLVTLAAVFATLGLTSWGLTRPAEHSVLVCQAIGPGLLLCASADSLPDARVKPQAEDRPPANQGFRHQRPGQQET